MSYFHFLETELLLNIQFTTHYIFQLCGTFLYNYIFSFIDRYDYTFLLWYFIHIFSSDLTDQPLPLSVPSMPQQDSVRFSGLAVLCFLQYSFHPPCDSLHQSVLGCPSSWIHYSVFIFSSLSKYSFPITAVSSTFVITAPSTFFVLHALSFVFHFIYVNLHIFSYLSWVFGSL